MSDANHDVVPRYEFRAFACCFGAPVDRLRQLSKCQHIEEVRDIYLVAAGADRYNVKIRGNQLSIKELLERRNGLELWKPSLNLDFPAPAAEIGQHVFRALALEIPGLGGAAMAREDFIRDVAVPHPLITVGTVFKRRFHFSLGDCPAEMVELLVNGAAIESMAVEGEEQEKVLAARELIGLEKYENVSYLRALKRIMGHEVLPEDELHGPGGQRNGEGN